MKMGLRRRSCARKRGRGGERFIETLRRRDRDDGMTDKTKRYLRRRETTYKRFGDKMIVCES